MGNKIKGSRFDEPACAQDFPKDVTLNYHHAGIYVSNLDRSIKWYSDALNYKLVNIQESLRLFEVNGSFKPFECTIATLQHGNHYLQLFKLHRDIAPFNYNHYKGECGLKHVCFVVSPMNKYNKLIDYLYEKGIRFTVGGSDKHHVKEPLRVKHISRVFILDPDGIPIEIVGRE